MKNQNDTFTLNIHLGILCGDVDFEPKLLRQFSPRLKGEIEKVLSLEDNSSLACRYHIRAYTENGLETALVEKVRGEFYMQPETAPEMSGGDGALQSQPHNGKAEENIKGPADQLPGLQPLHDAARVHYKLSHSYRQVIDASDIIIVTADVLTERLIGSQTVRDYLQIHRKMWFVFDPSANKYTPHNTAGSGIADAIKHIRRITAVPLPDNFNCEYKTVESAALKEFTKGVTALTTNFDWVQQSIIPLEKQASLLTGQFKELYQYAGLFVYLLSPLAIVCVTLGIIFHHYSWLFFTLEFIILVSILSIITYADKKRAHRNWLQHRFWSERLRAVKFMAVCGIRPNPIHTQSHLRIAHHPESWMVRLHKEIIARIIELQDPVWTDTVKEMKQYIETFWLNEQVSYHTLSVKRNGRRSRQFEKLGRMAFYAALTAAGAHILLSFFDVSPYTFLIELPLVGIAIIFPAIGAALGAIRAHREFSRLEKRSQNMLQVLEEEREKLDEITEFAEFREWLLALDDIFLQEAQDWLTLMRFAKLEAV